MASGHDPSRIEARAFLAGTLRLGADTHANRTRLRARGRRCGTEKFRGGRNGPHGRSGQAGRRDSTSIPTILERLVLVVNLDSPCRMGVMDEVETTNQEPPLLNGPAATLALAPAAAIAISSSTGVLYDLSERTS